MLLKDLMKGIKLNNNIDAFLDVDIIIFEEFMERGSYIPREVDRLRNILFDC